MMHTRRLWGFVWAESIEDLCDILTSKVMTCCAAFKLEHGGRRFLFLNDAKSEDGAQEYAILRLDRNAWLQIESVTFSWCTKEKAVRIVTEILEGADVTEGRYLPNFERADRHRCALCA